MLLSGTGSIARSVSLSTFTLLLCFSPLTHISYGRKIRMWLWNFRAIDISRVNSSEGSWTYADRWTDWLHVWDWGWHVGFVKDWVALLVIRWRLWVGSNRCHCGFCWQADTDGWPELPCCKIRSWIFVGWTHSKASEPTETDSGVWDYDMGFVKAWVVLLVIKWRLWVGRNCCNCGFVGKLTVEGDQTFTMKYIDHSWVLSEWIPFSRLRSTLQSVFEKPFFCLNSRI